MGLNVYAQNGCSLLIVNYNIQKLTPLCNVTNQVSYNNTLVYYATLITRVHKLVTGKM
jgi:hypothetical protein